jgi:predicted RND superfamily exporter protein
MKDKLKIFLESNLFIFIIAILITLVLQQFIIQESFQNNIENFITNKNQYEVILEEELINS